MTIEQLLDYLDGRGIIVVDLDLVEEALDYYNLLLDDEIVKRE